MGNNKKPLLLIFDDSKLIPKKSFEHRGYEIRYITPNESNGLKSNAYKEIVVDSIDKYNSAHCKKDAILIDYEMTDILDVDAHDILSEINNKHGTYENVNIYFFSGGNNLSPNIIAEKQQEFSRLNIQDTYFNAPNQDAYEAIITELESKKHLLKLANKFEDFPSPLRILHHKKGIVFNNKSWNWKADIPPINDFFESTNNTNSKPYKTESITYADTREIQEGNEQSPFQLQPLLQIRSFIFEYYGVVYLIQYTENKPAELGRELDDILLNVSDLLEDSKYSDGSFLRFDYCQLHKLSGQNSTLDQHQFFTKEELPDKSDENNECRPRELFDIDSLYGKDATYKMSKTKKQRLNYYKAIEKKDSDDANAIIIPILSRKRAQENKKSLLALLRLRRVTHSEQDKHPKNQISLEFDPSRSEPVLHNIVTNIAYYLERENKKKQDEVHRRFDKLLTDYKNENENENVAAIIQSLIKVARETSDADIAFFTGFSNILFDTKQQVYVEASPELENKEKIVPLLETIKLSRRQHSNMPSVQSYEKKQCLSWHKQKNKRMFTELIQSYDNDMSLYNDTQLYKESKDDLVRYFTNVKSVMTLPIIVSEEVIAVFSLHSSNHYAFDKQVEKRLKSLTLRTQNLLTEKAAVAIRESFLEAVIHELRNDLLPLRDSINSSKSSKENKSLMHAAYGMLDRNIHNLILHYREVDEQYYEKIETLELKPMIEIEIENIKVLKSNIISTKDIRFDLNCDDFTYKTNELSLLIILRNLLNNAIKYSQEKTTIKISLVEHHNKWKFSVQNIIDPEQDTLGEGIVKKMVKLRGSGFGIGLDACHKLATVHNLVFDTDIDINNYIATLQFPKNGDQNDQNGQNFND